VTNAAEHVTGETRPAPGSATIASGSFIMPERLLAGQPIGRIVGPEAMKFDGWQRLTAEYARQFGIETPNRPEPLG
jgi:hypothetical protein